MFSDVDKMIEHIDLSLSDDSDDEKDQIEQAFLEGECSELGIKLTLLIKKWLPDYFEKELVLEHLQDFTKQLKNEASCLSAWRIIFQQLNIITLFLHTLISKPLPKHFKNTEEFNQVQQFALEIITLRAELLYTQNGDHDIFFTNGNKNFYEQQVIMRFLDPSKLAKELVKTIGPDLTPSTREHIKALNLFVNKVCSAMRMVRYALELIDKQMLYVDTATLQDHLPIVKQSFYFYDEAIVESPFNHFLKIDLYTAKKNAFMRATDRENYSAAAAADYYKELLICEIFAYESFIVVLAQFTKQGEIWPFIAEEYRRELKLKIGNEKYLRELVKSFQVSVPSQEDKQAYSLYLYFDYAAFFIEVERIKSLSEKEAVIETCKIAWEMKYNLDCLTFITNCLRKNIEIYQHREHDAHFKALLETKKCRPVSKPVKVESVKVEIEEKKFFSAPMQEPLENLQQKIDLLRAKKQDFYDLYNPAMAHRAVKSQPKRETKLLGFKNSLLNTVMIELERICLKLDALKFKFYSDEAVKEFSSYVEKVEELAKLTDKIILDITQACKCWNITTKITPAPEPMRRRHSDNSFQKKTQTSRRIYTTRCAKSVTPPGSPPKEDDIIIQAIGSIEIPDTLLEAKPQSSLDRVVSDLSIGVHPINRDSSDKNITPKEIEATLAVLVLIHVDSLGDISTQIFKHLASLDVTTTDTNTVTAEENIFQTTPLDAPVEGTIISDGVLENKELVKGENTEANKSTYTSIGLFAQPIDLNIRPYCTDIFESWRNEFPQKYSL
jgi:hypothetical protein